MNLLQEYLDRHHIRIPVVYHVACGNLILRVNSRPQVIMCIEWIGPRKRPGYYSIDYYSPIHNGYFSNKVIKKLESKRVLQYEDYIPYITKWSSHSDIHPVKTEEVKLATWEMFIYSIDSAVKDFEKLVYKTIDPTLSIVERNNNIDEVLCYLNEAKPSMFATYNKYFAQYCSNYADWLVDLIEYKK